MMFIISLFVIMLLPIRTARAEHLKQIEAAREFMEEYKNALRELAE